MKRGLAGFHVLDLTRGIAGAYATKLFVDAGADVVKVGDPGSRALDRFLAAGKRIAVPSPKRERALREAADLIVSDELDPPWARA